MTDVDAALVIVNYRSAELTARCVDLARASARGVRLEPVVVDNASGDRSPARLRALHPGLNVLEQPANGGFAAGVNTGFAASSAPFVVLLNPDTEPRPGALARLVEHLRAHPRVGVAAPLLLHPDGGFQHSAHRRFPSLLTLFVDFCVPLGLLIGRRPDLHPHELTREETERGGPVAHVNGSALAVRREAYLDAGPFDEGFFMYLEETEWQQRLRGAGWTVEVVPQAEVVHRGRTGAPLSSIARIYLDSIFRYMRKQGHRERSVRAVLAAASALSLLALWAIAAASPSRRAELDDLLSFHRSVLRYLRARGRRP
jgi:N-acetylglucosaminyl-diphospho-decaprenol L-rhamnosyltransferase